MRTGGALMGRWRPAMLRAFAVFALVLVTAALAACGNAASGPSATHSPSNLISRAEVKKAPAGVQQAFLEYWSALQYQAWTEAASYYDLPFRSFIGAATIIGAKKLNAPSYPELKPSVVAITSHAGLTTIRYYVYMSNGTKELASVTWREVGGNWQIVYDSRLDAELSQFAENRVELARTGTLPTNASKVSSAAARAGQRAALSQARFVEQKLDLSHP